MSAANRDPMGAMNRDPTVANSTFAVPPAVNVDSATNTVANPDFGGRHVPSVELAQ